MKKEGKKTIAKNKRAFFDYSIESTIECGVVLQGTEVKSAKEGKISFNDSFAEVQGGEVFIKNFSISEYAYSSFFNHRSDRIRKLLLHKDEIKRLERRVREKGFTLIPLEFYLKNGRLKILLGVCKGRKLFDKRENIKDKDLKRDMQREIKKSYL